MNKKKLYVFLGCEAALCLLLHFAREILPRAFTTVMAFPFEQIGLGLRTLSLSGEMGNILSIVLYLFLCLIPVVVLIAFNRKRSLYPEDSLLVILSLVLFVVLYLMVNPGLLGPYWANTAGQSMGKAVLGGMVYSIVIGYLVLRVLRLFYYADTGRLQKYISVLLCALNVLFVYLVFGAYFSSLMDSFDALRSGNIGNEHNLGMSYLFLILQYVINALPYILDVLVVFAALNLLDELSADRYSEASVTAARRLSRLCGRTLAITVVSHIVFNLLQLVFFKTLVVVNGTVQIPLMSIAFILAALLLAQYIGDNKQLKDDNDLFI